MKTGIFIGKSLLEWYAENHRELPWRGIFDPYRIWISEIILQQTRVAQGLEYYNRFIRRFPNVRSLAEAPEQEVLTYWQGLGYYSRARNIHAAARAIVAEHGGEFPRRHADVLRLKGIGEYTAAAIVSFAWNEPYPVVDGNVFRFLSRLFAVDEPVDTSRGKKYFTELAGELMDRAQAGAFNQAIMEFGALQCIPVSPDCGACIFRDKCLAYADGTVARYPVKQNKTQTQDRYLYYFYINDGVHFFLKQRVGKGIWQNLFEFPCIESERPLAFDELVRRSTAEDWFPAMAADAPPTLRLRIENRKHVLSHRILYASFYSIMVKQLPAAPSGMVRITRGEMENYPIHRLMQGFWEEED